jgi:hypothetical protein
MSSQRTLLLLSFLCAAARPYASRIRNHVSAVLSKALDSRIAISELMPDWLESTYLLGGPCGWSTQTSLNEWTPSAVRLPAELLPTPHRSLVLGSPGQLTAFVNNSLLKRSLDRFPAAPPLTTLVLRVRLSRAQRLFPCGSYFQLLTVDCKLSLIKAHRPVCCNLNLLERQNGEISDCASQCRPHQSPAR